MHLLKEIAALLTLAVISQGAVVEKRNSPSFAGTNNYFLHGVSQADQTNYINTIAGWGMKVVRLWVTSTPSGCQKGSKTIGIPDLEDTVGTYNPAVLDALDKVLAQLHAKGIKAIISPHDGNILNPGDRCDPYCKKYGSSDNFYSSADAKSSYDKRLAYILNYKSPNFGGKPWSQLSEAILAFDIQNEPMIASVGKLKANDPDDWICGRAGNMKNIIGSSGVKIATGGLGGSEYCCDHEFNIIDKALYCSAIDILSVHGYMTSASQWSYFIPKLSDQAAAQGKHLMIEEWGVNASPGGQFADQVAVFNNAGVPWLYWQVVPGPDATQSCTTGCCTGYDGFEIGLTSSKGNVKAGVQAANGKTGRQDWTGYVY